MPYGLIAVLVTIGTTAWFVVASEASDRAKFAVAAIALLTLGVPYLAPDWSLAALIVQAVLVIGLLLYLTYTSARR